MQSTEETVVPDVEYKLTNRMLEALEDIAAGLSVKASAERRFITEYTMKSHRRRLLQRLGARNGAHAVRIAVLAGILCVDKIEPMEGWRSEETHEDPGRSSVPGVRSGVPVDATEEVGQGPVVPGVPEVRGEARTRNDPDREREGGTDGVGGNDVRRPRPPVAGVRRATRCWRYTGDSE